MKTASKLTYALVLGFIALMPSAWAIDPIDHQPISDLIAALKKNGHVRIAQGLQGVLAKDSNTGELFTTRCPLMLTTNKQTGEWTISVFNDKIVGSTLLIGTNLQRVSSNDFPQLPTFDRQKANAAISKLNADKWGAAYYQDEIERMARDHHFRRLFTGQISITAEPAFNEAMKPLFFDVLIAPDNEFGILVVDQYGACAPIAFGGEFAENP